MAVKNSTILGKFWLQSSLDFQQRIPAPDQATIAQTVDHLFDPLNSRCYNEFMNGLVNRIGMTYTRERSFKNPLAVFKRNLQWGSSVQEVCFRWIKAHSYNDASETLLKMERPEVLAAYHTQNRQDAYPITISREELRQAFTDEFGLNNLITAAMNVPINSDEYDEYIIMKQLIAEYEDQFGFFKQAVTAPADEATAKAFLKQLRAYADKFRFPSCLYNANLVDVPVFADPSECVLLITPEAKASIDVDGLAAVFQLDKADVLQRVIVVDEFPVPDMVALLTTEDFYQCYDTEYTTTSFFDAEKMATKYYLQHWSALSVSPFVPAVAFVTGDGTSIPTVAMTTTSLSIAGASTVEPGGTVELTTTLNGTISDNEGGAVVAPQSVTWSIALKDGEKNSRTYVDRFNVLHVQKTVEAGEEITLTAVSTYINPSGSTSVLTATKKITVA